MLLAQIKRQRSNCKQGVGVLCLPAPRKLWRANNRFEGNKNMAGAEFFLELLPDQRVIDLQMKGDETKTYNRIFAGPQRHILAFPEEECRCWLRKRPTSILWCHYDANARLPRRGFAHISVFTSQSARQRSAKISKQVQLVLSVYARAGILPVLVQV